MPDPTTDPAERAAYLRDQLAALASFGHGAGDPRVDAAQAELDQLAPALADVDVDQAAAAPAAATGKKARRG